MLLPSLHVLLRLPLGAHASCPSLGALGVHTSPSPCTAWPAIVAGIVYVIGVPLGVLCTLWVGYQPQARLEREDDENVKLKSSKTITAGTGLFLVAFSFLHRCIMQDAQLPMSHVHVHVRKS